MTPDQFKNLKPGDTVRHKAAAEAMVVVEALANGCFLALRTTTLSNPREWLLIGDDGRPVSEHEE